jgi:hypothetical protein
MPKRAKTLDRPQGRGREKDVGHKTALFGASQRATGTRQNKRMCRLNAKWRDPDSNWGHHDFQGRENEAGKAARVLQIGGSQLSALYLNTRSLGWLPLG